MNPLPFLLICGAGWMNRHEQVVIGYLEEEVCALKVETEGHIPEALVAYQRVVEDNANTAEGRDAN